MKLGNGYNLNKTAFKILLVEDNAQIASKIQLMLNEIPQVEVIGFARDVNKAIYLINEQSPDLIILDIQLDPDNTGKSGIDLLKIIQNSYPTIEVIMLSNHSEPQYVDLCLNLGARFYLDKSLDFEKLPEKIIDVYIVKNTSTS